MGAPARISVPSNSGTDLGFVIPTVVLAVHVRRITNANNLVSKGVGQSISVSPSRVASSALAASS